MDENTEYIKNAFTKTEDNTNLEVDNLNVTCITSKNNNFDLDSDGNLTVKSINVVNNNTILNLIYPVGSIYMSVSNVNPTDLFGGSWEQIKDRFLLACGDTYQNASTGGSATVTLTVAQMPVHTHAISSSGGHSHTAKFKEMYIGAKANGSRDHARKQSTTDQDSTARVTVSDGAHTHSPANAGSGQAHNNMPPYIAVYMWKRTA